jgi:hypothetical protein
MIRRLVQALQAVGWLVALRGMQAVAWLLGKMP